MTDGRGLHKTVAGAAVAASAVAAACGTLIMGDQGPLECADGVTANAVIVAGIFSDVADDWTFTPPEVTITAGQTVCWALIHGASHTITPTAGGTFGGTIDPNQRWVLDTFTVAGDYPYVCQVHSQMQGMVKVNPS